MKNYSFSMGGGITILDRTERGYLILELIGMDSSKILLHGRNFTLILPSIPSKRRKFN